RWLAVVRHLGSRHGRRNGRVGCTPTTGSRDPRLGWFFAHVDPFVLGSRGGACTFSEGNGRRIQPGRAVAAPGGSLCGSVPAPAGPSTSPASLAREHLFPPSRSAHGAPDPFDNENGGLPAHDHAAPATALPLARRA